MIFLFLTENHLIGNGLIHRGSVTFFKHVERTEAVHCVHLYLVHHGWHALGYGWRVGWINVELNLLK
jgi:hypothetical protein